MTAFAYLPDDEPLREVLDADIYVEPKDKDSADEDARQIALINRVKHVPGLAYHAVPNGGRQSDWARIRAEKMGVVAGQPDLGFDWVGGSAVIEMKNGTEKPRPDQVSRLNKLHRMGKRVAVCRTAAGALAWLASVGAPVGRGL
ncbi:MAG: VRR-NUC domain-containing protein [Devosia sp.]|uniref:VRR-NUC domain-containing protein n=1 Tax=Devosia sp. TaxID=1871048 RepID=UPI003396F032